MVTGPHLALRQGFLSGPYAAAGGFLAALEAWWAQERQLPLPVALPFTGGWLLYLGYEIAQEIEPTLRLPASPDPLTALALRAPAAWLRDRHSGQSCVVAEAGSEHLLGEFAAHVAALPADLSAPAVDAGYLEEEPAARFLDAVVRALAYTADGEVYQTNLSRAWTGTLPADRAGALYGHLRRANPAPFAAFLRHGEFAIVSSSPERLVRVRDGRVATRPIAGTRPRGSTAELDRHLVQTLLGDEKERAENIMLIDLERNDLGRVCRGGSVQVDEFMSVESYAHVHHIVSNVSGEMIGSAGPVDVIRALFPGGTITGCPKVRCMQIIGELEGAGRGAYTGSLGYLNRDGSLDLNILIRTITCDNGRFRFRAGAGIVADSVPAQELAETRAKAEGLRRALGLRT